MPRFCTAFYEGRPCTYRARPGEPFCAGHSPRLAEAYRPCAFFNRRGTPCSSHAIRGHDYCFTHSPRNRRAKHPAIPLQPRTRRQKLAAKWLLFSTMPQSRALFQEALLWQ